MVKTTMKTILYKDEILEINMLKDGMRTYITKLVEGVEQETFILPTHVVSLIDPNFNGIIFDNADMKISTISEPDANIFSIEKYVKSSGNKKSILLPKCIKIQ